MSLASNLDSVKIKIGKKTIEITEIYTVQNYTGLGYVQDKQASLETMSNTVIHIKENLQVSLNQNKITIKSSLGSIHSFDYEKVDSEQAKNCDAVEFIRKILN